MLHECHIHFADVRSHHYFPICNLLSDCCPGTAIHTIAKGFRVWVSITHTAFECVGAIYISCSFLVQVYHCKTAVEIGAILHGVVVKPGDLLLIYATVIAVTFFASSIDQ